MKLKILSETKLQDHDVPGTQSIRYSFSIEKDGTQLSAGESTATQNSHGVFLDLPSLHAQVPDSYLRKALIVRIKQFLQETT